MLKDILKKEMRQFRRNEFMPRTVIMFPIVIMLLMPLVANMEVRNVNVAVVDEDGQDLSQLFVQRVQASENLSLEGIYRSYDEALQRVEECEADIIVEIPNGFSRGERQKINVSANAVNSTKGSLGLQYVMQIINDSMQATTGQQPSDMSVRYLYNDTLNYRHFMIPALMIMLIIAICGFLPALNMVSEKELGTIEQINVTPVSKFTFTMSKLLPYWVIGLVVVSIGMLVGWLVYGLAPACSLLTIYAATFIFSVVMSSMSISVANVSHNMQQVMFVMFFFVIVFILMSGMLTPVQSMPAWAQNLSLAIPSRYFIDIMRASYLRGANIADQWLWFTIMTAFAVGFSAIAALTYQKRDKS